MDIRKSAFSFAKYWHGDQKRKYLGTPYWLHCLEVAELADTVDVAGCHSKDRIYCAALLHDILEDTKCPPEDIQVGFGPPVRALVEMVTDYSFLFDGNRKERKRIYNQHLGKACPCGQTIKLADLISNSQSILALDPKFAKVYLKEKEDTMKVLTEGSPKLRYIALSILSGQAHA